MCILSFYGGFIYFFFQYFTLFFILFVLALYIPLVLVPWSHFKSNHLSIQKSGQASHNQNIFTKYYAIWFFKNPFYILETLVMSAPNENDKTSSYFFAFLFWVNLEACCSFELFLIFFLKFHYMCIHRQDTFLGKLKCYILMLCWNFSLCSL